MPAILIVDDSLTVRTDLGEALEAAGFRAIPCGTIAEARSALRSQQVALAILDVRLPDGDGIELLQKIRRDPTIGELPVLMLSSEADVEDRVRGLQTGASDFVGKPYDTTHVIARIRQLIGGPPVRDLVLVIDDNDLYRKDVGEALAGAGFATAVARSGAEGLQLAASVRPTAVLVAATMPDVDGPSVVRRLRLDPGLRTTPVLLLATSGEAKDAEVRALEAGADGLVRKDDLAVVVARIRALLRSVGASGLRITGSTLAPKRILAVDDDPDYLELLGDRLRKRGYDVVRAESGEDAIKLLSLQSADCILLDRSMAGIGGIETCKRLKAAPGVRDIPLIMLTATDKREAVLEGLSAGADDYLTKGSGFEVLTARVQAQIRRKQIEDEQRLVRDRLLRSELEASEARAARELAEKRAAFADQLEATNAELVRTNRELEAFSYSVSHDLRAPLRTINAFVLALVEDLGEKLEGRSLDHIRRVLAASSRMGDLIDSLLELARISRVPLGRHRIDLSVLATAAIYDLARGESRRDVDIIVTPHLEVDADARLMRILLDNLFDNAWKFTAECERPTIELGVSHQGDEPVYYVRDNGEGFDMAHADRLFTPFACIDGNPSRRGIGIGLATVRKIVERHGGRVWAEGQPDRGAQISFTVPAPQTS
ncbi:MAG: response regulator [Kofleriaceae bacterium]|nr:response regulator [Kofleriaceae bacterium]